MTLEERQAKFNELVDTVLKVKAIMDELNADPSESAEHVLDVSIYKWNSNTNDCIMLNGYGDQNKVDVVKLDKVEETPLGNIRFYTYVKGVKVYMLGDKEE